MTISPKSCTGAKLLTWHRRRPYFPPQAQTFIMPFSQRQVAVEKGNLIAEAGLKLAHDLGCQAISGTSTKALVLHEGQRRWPAGTLLSCRCQSPHGARTLGFDQGRP